MDKKIEATKISRLGRRGTTESNGKEHGKCCGIRIFSGFTGFELTIMHDSEFSASKDLRMEVSRGQKLFGSLFNKDYVILEPMFVGHCLRNSPYSLTCRVRSAILVLSKDPNAHLRNRASKLLSWKMFDHGQRSHIRTP